MNHSPIALAIHGGAGTLLKSEMSPEKEAAYTSALDHIITTSYKSLSNGATALDVVELAVSLLEDSPLFNAGKGSVFTATGTHEMDASIMEGANKTAGAVCLVKNIKNPIKLAKRVMTHSDHVLLSGPGAESFAIIQGMEIADQDYFYDEYRYKQWQSVQGSDKVQLDHSPLDEKKFGTVGAVALDQDGNVAAATSTGGMTNKRYGRIGDSPIIGAGTYADNKTCAVSCTGSGEYFLRHVTAYRVSVLMELQGLSLEEACNKAVNEELVEINGDGGLIALDAKGNISLTFNTEGMYRASQSSAQAKEVKIYG